MIYRVDENFIVNNINPFTGAEYDDSWIMYELTNSSDYEIICGKGENSVYTLSVSKNYPQWEMSLFDFLKYQEIYHKNIILSVSDEDYEQAKIKYHGHDYNDKFLRDDEPAVLIHSTTLENWIKIEKDGCLKSWNTLKKQNLINEEYPIGKLIGDPTDFSDFIMFSGGSISSEIVVLSKQRGEITMNQDMEYIPGARLYFDMKKIAEDGLLIRDGCHLKVKDKLPLKPYLLWVANWQTVGLKSARSTPKEFTRMSNDLFNQLFGDKVHTTF